ncbi:MAG: hypothetical protein ACLPKB_26165 [Xanthobacteraceae bacterium]
MPYRDLRDCLAILEQHDLPKRVAKEVDRDWEIACLAKWMYRALPVERQFGFLFENVKGSKIPVITGALGASPRSVALALRCEIEQINDKVVSLCAIPLSPKRRARACAKRMCCSAKPQASQISHRHLRSRSIG